MTAKKTAAPRGIEDILDAARPREALARVCMAGDLAADADRITGEIERLGTYLQTSLADVDPRTALRADLEKIHNRMRAAEVTFRFRALPPEDYSNLLAAHPGRTADEAWNPLTFSVALIAASCVEPVMTLEQAVQLYGVVNQHSRSLLWSAAWRANTGETQVPFSLAASPSPSS